MGSPVPIGFTRLVGRERECRELLAAVEDARQGRGRVVLLSGEAGIGKTRLCEEVESHAREQGFATFWGHGIDEGAPPYWPWMQIIRGYFRTRMTPDVERALGPAAADLAFFAPGHRQSDLSPAALPRLIDAVLALLRAASAACPLVLFFDDLHAADLSSLKLLQFLAVEVRDLPLLVVGAYRHAEAGLNPLVGKLLLELAHRATPIALRGLDLPAMGEVMSDVAGFELQEKMAGLLCGRAGGNPLFARELARYLKSPTDDESFARAALTVPHAVSDLIVGRLRLLSQPAQAILTAAAVAGMESPSSLLAEVCRLEPSQCLACLDEAFRSGIAEPAHDGMAFRQTLVRQAIYRSIPIAERARLHHAFAVAAAPSYSAAAEPRYAELAYHFALGASFGGWEKVVEYERLAGEWAAARLAFDEAVVHFSRALERGANLDVAQRCEVLLALGDALLATGESGRGVEALLEAAELARGHGCPRLLGRIALRSGRLGASLREHPRFIQLCRDALAALGEDEPALRAPLLARLAAVRSTPDRLTLGRRALEMVGTLQDPRTAAEVLLDAHHAFDGVAEVEERLAIASQAEAMVSTLGRRDLLLEASHARFLALVELDDLVGAERELARCARLAGELRSSYYEWLTRSHEAMLALSRGQLADAERLADESYRAGERAGATLEARSRQLLFSWRLRREQNRLGELAPRALAMIAQAPGAPIWRVLLAQARLAEGDQGHARALLTTIHEDGPRDDLWLGTQVGLAELAMALGDEASMNLLRGRLSPFDGRNVVVGRGAALLGPVSLTLEKLAKRDSTPAPSLTAVLMEPSGAEWIVRWGATSVSIADNKGTRYLAELVRNPDRELHVTELAARVSEARSQLAERLAGERGPEVERLRQSITKRLREAIKKIGEKDALLGRHLSQTISTGTTCRYAP